MKPASPLPWRPRYDTYGVLYGVEDSKGMPVVEDVDAYDSEYIVRAANAFPKLVKALEAIHKTCRSGRPNVERVADVEMLAREALALAKGEK